MNKSAVRIQPALTLSGLGMTLQKVEDIPKNVYLPPGCDTFRLTDLTQEDSHYKEMSIDFENAGLDIVRVQKLQNLMKLKAFKGHRDLFLEQRSTLNANFHINERYLYHGTSADINDLCELGLDDKLSGNGCFGKGIYFSDNPKKCTKYANRRLGDEAIIICARVILGDSKIYPKGMHDRALLREPEKKGDIQGWRFYDSVQGCPTDFTEFVVYRAQMAMIEYLITYSKSSLKKTALVENATCSTKPKVSAVPDSLRQKELFMTCRTGLKDKDSRLRLPVVSDKQRLSEDLNSRIRKSVVSDKQRLSEDLNSRFRTPGVFNSDLNSRLRSLVVSGKQRLSGLLNSTSQSPSTIPDEDPSSSESDGENDDRDPNYLNDGAPSSDEEDEIQVKRKDPDSDSESTESGSDTDSKEEDLGNKRKDKNVESFGSCGNAKKQEMILTQKRRRFTDLTKEYSEPLVETFLLAADFDVSRAVQMYHQKKRKDTQKFTNRPVERKEDKQIEHVATERKREPDFVPGKTVPDFNSPQWNQMSEEDKEVAVTILEDNFLSVTGLCKENAPLARKILHMTQYNLDQAIVSYYESI